MINIEDKNSRKVFNILSSIIEEYESFKVESRSSSKKTYISFKGEVVFSVFTGYGGLPNNKKYEIQINPYYSAGINTSNSTITFNNKLDEETKKKLITHIINIIKYIEEQKEH
jgi:hypothetical protein